MVLLDGKRMPEVADFVAMQRTAIVEALLRRRASLPAPYANVPDAYLVQSANLHIDLAIEAFRTGNGRRIYENATGMVRHRLGQGFRPEDIIAAIGVIRASVFEVVHPFLIRGEIPETTLHDVLGWFDAAIVWIQTIVIQGEPTGHPPVEGVPPAGPGGAPKLPLSQLMQTPDTGIALGLFTAHVRRGLPGLCISREAPDRIRKQTGLQEISVLWLTTTRAGGVATISPTSMLSLSVAITRFLDESEDGIVLLDGIAYLVTQNDFSTILRLVQFLRDKIAISRSRMLIVVPPDILAPAEASALGRELEAVPAGTAHMDA